MPVNPVIQEAIRLSWTIFLTMGFAPIQFPKLTQAGIGLSWIQFLQAMKQLVGIKVEEWMAVAQKLIFYAARLTLLTLE